MQAEQVLLLDLLAGQNQQFEIPLYQRRYSWTNTQRLQLWNDVLRIAQAPKGRRHFTGPVVFTEPRGSMGAGALHRSRLVDGQQRITTTSLLLLALVEHLEVNPAAAQQVNREPDELRFKYLLNQSFNSDKRLKLRLSSADAPTFRAVLFGEELPKQESQEVRNGLQFFRRRFAELGADVEQVWHGLNKLEIVQIMLTEGVDDLGLIFESLNSTGKALAQADLIRNNVLMGLDEHEQTSLSEKLWQPMEELFADTEEGSFDRFMRDFLTLRTRSLPNEGEVYTAFKDYRQSRPEGESATELVEDIGCLARHYLRILQPSKEGNLAVRLALEDLAALRLRVIQPFVLELLEDRQKGLLSDTALERALRVVESFLMRRAVVGERTSPLNRFFATLGRDLPKHDDYVRSLERTLVRFQDRDRDGFPSDEAFSQALREAPLYTRPVCKPLLVRLERQQNTKESFGGVLTIEHVMPQNEKLGEPWRQMLGEDWQEVQRQLVHTLGNLTLTGYNSELGDRPFTEKKTLPPKQGDTPESALPKGYQYSRLLLTQDVAKHPEWNEAVIRGRAQTLADQAVALFPFPQLSAEEVEKLRSEGRQRNVTPTVEGHLETSSPALRSLFGQVQARLKDLHHEVAELPQKHYVAYKIGGANFCDVVPQPALDTVKGWLNLPPEEVDDPHHLTRDITGKGKPGNGNVELTLSLHSDLDAFEALARQALEYQQGRLAGKVTKDADGASVAEADLAALPAQQQQVATTLEERLLALPGVERVTNKYHISFKGRQVFLEVRARKAALHLSVKGLPGGPQDDTASEWQSKGIWWTRKIRTLENLEAAWPTLQDAYEAQQAVLSLEPAPSEGEGLDA